MFQRASPEKYDPVAEDTALGLSLSGMDRGIWLTAWKGEGPSSHIRPFVAPVSLSLMYFPTTLPTSQLPALFRIAAKDGA